MLRGILEAPARLLSDKTDGLVVREVNGTYFSPIDADDFRDELWAAAGASSPAGAMLIVILVGSWMVWPVNYLQIKKIFSIGGVRSDTIFSYFFGLVLPTYVLASGVLIGYDAFAWIKVFSLMGAAVIFTAIKYHLPPPNRLFRGSIRMSYVYSQLGHGILFVNVLEAVVWEATQLQGEAYNYINAFTGFVQMLCIIAYAKRYGFGVIEKEQENLRELRGNLTPLYIVGYTIWNIEYNATYHPEKAMFYTYVTVLIPFAAAFLGQIDWLEIRAQALLHGICLRVGPLQLDGPIFSTVLLFDETFESDVFRYTFSILGLIATVFIVWEVFFRVNVHKKHFDFWGFAKNVDVDERHFDKYYGDGDDDDDDRKSGVVMASDL